MTQDDDARDLKKDLIVAQYNGLRDEILKQIEIQSQWVALAVLVLGTAVGVSIQSGNASNNNGSAAIALAYPLFGLFLALAWATNEREIRLKGAYIADHIERPFQPADGRHASGEPDFGWEHHIHELRARQRPWHHYAHGGIFAITELAAMGVGGFLLARTSTRGFDAFAWGLFAGPDMTVEDVLITTLIVADIICFALTLLVVASAQGANFREGGARGDAPGKSKRAQ